MKLIKKIAAIMFAFMMVVSMSCNVKADEGSSSSSSSPTTKGTITITNAKEGETYKLYKILSLESYSYTGNDKDKGNYAYTLTGDTKWDNFIKNQATQYFKFDDTNKYLTWTGTMDEARVKDFAQLALKFARNESNNVQPIQKVEKTNSSTVKFDNLDLGYYLVDSSVGSLCVLNTTNPNLTIAEKNGVPSVEKGVSNTKNGTYGTSNNASIGDTVYFKTTITAQPGAQNYVLHDKMTEGLTFDKNSVNVTLHKKATNVDETLGTNADYNVEITNLEKTDPKCTFHINFTQTLCDRLAANDTITVTYSATLNENAVIAGEGNKNETKLKYGDSQETQPSVTNTKTFKMDVFKFYIDKNDLTTEKGLADAKFTLSKNKNGTDPIKLIDKGSNTYRVAKTDETNTITEVITPDNGRFTIQGLGAGTYYLTETKQPAGYNKLANAIEIEIDNNGNIKVNKNGTLTSATQVDVENKTGTVLPSTGGAGTTMIYLVGAVLVLGSGVVLATKRRVKDK